MCSNVSCNNVHLTSYVQARSGVKQGCIFSPFLFSIFISEFVKEINCADCTGIELLSNDSESNCLLYADDLSIFADTVRNMQKKMDFLQKYCTKLNLKVNIQKSKMVVFRYGGYLRNSEKWWFENKRIEVVTYYSYLGMLFSSRLCWSAC